MYVTPALFRNMYTGMAVDTLSDIQLAMVLARARTVVDAYCSVPMFPERHDFRGGSVVEEAHEWRYPETPQSSGNIGTRRAYPFHWPVRAVQVFRIYVTNTQYVEIQAADLFVQNTARYLEVVSLAITSSGLFNALIIPNVGLATPTVKLTYTYGFTYSVTDEEIFAGQGNTLYQAVNQWWLVDADHPVVVKVNGTVVPSGYTVNANQGSILFAANPGPEGDSGDPVSVTASYTHRLPQEIRDAIGLITRHELGESNLARKGMQGLDSIRLAEIQLNRPRQPATRGGLVTVDNLERLVPEAADLLTGHKYWRAGG